MWPFNGSLPVGWLVMALLLSAEATPGQADSTRETVPVESEFHVRRWTTSDGLPKNLVRSLAQTPDGLLWLGTPDGLVRFDGRAFTVFDRSNTPTLANDHSVTRLLPDQAGRLWMTIGGQVFCLRGSEVLSARKAALPQSNLAGNLSLLDDGRVQILSDDPILHWAQARRSELVFVPQEITGPGALMQRSDTTGFWLDRAGRLTVSNVVSGVGREFTLPTWQLPVNRGICFAATPEPDGRWWILHGHNHDESSTTLYELHGHRLAPVATGLSSNGGRTFLVRDRAGALWFGQDSPGNLARFHQGRLERFHLPTTHSFDNAWCFLEGSDGAYWIGTDKSGLYRLEPKAVSAITPADGLPAENVRTVALDPSGRLWAGTDHGLTQIPTPAKGTAPIIGPVTLTNFSIRALTFTPDGSAWAGTGRGLFRLGHTAPEPWPLPLIDDGAENASLGSRKIRALLPSQSDGLWIASAHTLSVLPPGESLPRLFGFWGEGVPPTGLMLDPAGDLWFGTEGRGVGRVPREAITQFLSQPSNATTKKFWSGIFGRTFPSFASTNLHWLSTTNGLPSNQVWSCSRIHAVRFGSLRIRDLSAWLPVASDVRRL